MAPLRARSHQGPDVPGSNLAPGGHLGLGRLCPVQSPPEERARARCLCPGHLALAVLEELAAAKPFRN